FFDSGEKAPRSEGGGYGYVTAKQIEWYENTVAQLRENNMGENIPSMAFQHIPVPEIYDVLNVVPKGTQGAVKGHGSFGGNYYVLNPRLAHGDLNEGPCPPDVNSGQFESWVNQGDVIAACFGHDHVNDFFGVYKGITFLQTPGVGFYSYGDADKHGIRIIELNQSELNYTTKVVYYGDLIDEPVPAYLKSTGKQMFSIILIGIALVLAVAFTIAALIIRKKRSKQRKNRISG
ncbi:hypothetical protein LJC42_07130, partial [Eubacteriales bacterium OttesenSCG-928-K08]|nr:hypothetical protein [Eubacteriales bacterium OttesenSCG-928-K08]